MEIVKEASFKRKTVGESYDQASREITRRKKELRKRMTRSRSEEACRFIETILQQSCTTSAQKIAQIRVMFRENG